MKFTNASRMRLIVLGTAALVAPVVLYGQVETPPGQIPADPAQQRQTERQQQQQPGNAHANVADTTTQDSSANSGVTGQQMKDKMFLRKAAEGGMAEVKLGQLAADKASSADVKAFGQKMVTDHTALNDEMKPIADSMGVMLPKKLSRKDQEEYDKLNVMSGTGFDTEYITYMDKDHHADVREFRREASTAGDPTLKAAVEKGLQVIREHTRMVDQLAKDRGIPVPTRGGTPPAAPPPSQ